MLESHHIFKADSVNELGAVLDRFLQSHPDCKPVFCRWFLHDAASQALHIQQMPGAVSVIQQPPLDGSAAAVWLYAVEDADEVRYSHGLTIVRDDGVEHIWSAGMVSPRLPEACSASGHVQWQSSGSVQAQAISGGFPTCPSSVPVSPAQCRCESPEGLAEAYSQAPDSSPSYRQTAAVLEGYEAFLAGMDLNIRDHCVRTWFFCHDIDNNYSGLVKARKRNFSDCGLLPETHFIASTGIAGTSPIPGAIVQMDAYAVRGPLRQTYLYAPTHLNPTYQYGVTFERGVAVEYSGCRHCIISGTASIDNKGAVLYPGDVHAQTLRMWENVEVLLAEGQTGWEDVVQIIVYLRNASDYAEVAPLFASKFPQTPYVITHAPVCRPGWLIEMECIAIR